MNIPHVYSFASETNGPNVVIFGGIHGDEPCGVAAVNMLKSMIENEEIQLQCGSLTLAIGNVEACDKNVRQITYNMNRLFTDNPYNTTSTEYERAEILKPILQTADFFLDLHSTTSPTVPFTICEPHLTEQAKFLGVQHILTGWSEVGEVVAGDTENYVNAHGGMGFTVENGQHCDLSSVENAITTSINFLAFTGMIEQQQNVNDHTVIYSLFDVIPKTSESFCFTKQFQNFELLKKGDLIGNDSSTQHLAPKDCAIVMPGNPEKLAMGEELYFLAQIVE